MLALGTYSVLRLSIYFLLVQMAHPPDCLLINVVWILSLTTTNQNRVDNYVDQHS